MTKQRLILNFQDATGWHTNPEFVSDVTADFAENWARNENSLLCRLISDKLVIPYGGDPHDMLITRVVIIRKSDGGKVCEWPVSELASSALSYLHDQQAPYSHKSNPDEPPGQEVDLSS